MGKKASSYFLGDRIKIPLGEKQLRTASPPELVGDAHLQLFKVRSTGQLVISETRFYEAATSLKEVIKEEESDKEDIDTDNFPDDSPDDSSPTEIPE